MKKNNTTLLLIFSIFVAIIVVGLFVFFFKIIKNKNQHTSVVSTTLEEKMNEKEKSIMIAEKITEIKSTQELINNYFIDQNKIDKFVSYLEGIGSNTGSEVLVNEVEISPGTKNIVSFKLAITGTFQDVMETVTFLENIPYQVNVTQVYLNRKTELLNVGDTQTTKQGKTTKKREWQADVSFNILSL